MDVHFVRVTSGNCSEPVSRHECRNGTYHNSSLEYEEHESNNSYPRGCYVHKDGNGSSHVSFNDAKSLMPNVSCSDEKPCMCKRVPLKMQTYGKCKQYVNEQDCEHGMYPPHHNNTNNNNTNNNNNNNNNNNTNHNMEASTVIGFIGAGNMAQAIAKGLINSQLVSAAKVIASARTTHNLDTVWAGMGALTTQSNVEVVTRADIIFLSVKPHILPGVLDELNVHASGEWSQKLFVSVAAGVTIDFMQGKLNKVPSVKVIRTMPNTPCLVLSGVVVYSLGTNCTSADGDTLNALMKVVGHVEQVDEKNIDAMSSLMGCSIAWFYNVIEGMSDGGVKNGVPRDVSYRLTARAMEGAAKMVCESGKHVGQLKDEVTSPNGSTICGIYSLEQDGLRGIFMKAVQAATDRNRQLGKQ